MVDDDPSNIFEEASRRFGSSDRKKQKRQSAPPPRESLAQYEDIEGSFSRLEALHSGISNQLDEFHMKGGISPRQLTGFLSDPSNFSSSQWQFIQGEKKEEERRLWERLGPAGTAKLEKDRARKKKARGRKMRGSRKGKGWLGMD